MTRSRDNATNVAGDISGITAGVGLSGGGLSGNVTVTNSMATAIDQKADLVVGTAADTFSRLAVGTDNHTLIADSSAATGLSYAAGSKATLTTTGDVLYASSANTPARLGIGSSGQVLTVASGIPSWASASANAVGVFCYIDNNAIALSTTFTDFNFTDEYFDTDGFHDNTTNNNRLTVPAGLGGLYIVLARINFDTINVKIQVQFRWHKNGAGTIGGYWFSVYEANNPDNYLNMITFERLNAGDYLTLQGKRQTAQGGCRITGNGDGFGMIRIGA